MRALKAALAPYQAAGAYQPFGPKDDLGKGVRAIPAAGHTGGHMVYAFSAGGKEVWCVGDIIHVGAVQFERPKVAMAFDSDQDKAIAIRRDLFQKAAVVWKSRERSAGRRSNKVSRLPTILLWRQRHPQDPRPGTRTPGGNPRRQRFSRLV
jgi:glyoxylase-like metal-dependent hydrolase (beta-lactamase superfamily II)